MPRPKPARSSIRARTTFGATVALALALAAVALAVTSLVGRDLLDSVDSTVEDRLDLTVAAIEGGGRPVDLVDEGDDDSLVQVIGAEGRLLAASDDLEGIGPLVDSETDPHWIRLPGEEDDRYRVVAAWADLDGGDGDDAEAPGADAVLVAVARSAEDVDEGRAAVAGSLWLGMPIALLAVAVTTWVVTGRALRPVEAMRREVAEITEAQLDRRVPRPRGRDEVARLADTMNEMLQRLNESRDRNRRFVSDASHELRSPIATIRHELEVALAAPDEVEVSALAQRLLSEDLRLQYLVEDLLLLARSDEGRLGGAREPVDLDDIALDEVARLRALGGVSVDGSALGAGRVLGDQRQLAQVVRNLFDNAARHADGHVAVGISTAGQQVRLWVDDDGPGIPAGERRRVFERFARVDDARARRSGGTGLGLAIVAEVVAAHGGTVSVETSPLGGARLAVVIPAAP